MSSNHGRVSEPIGAEMKSDSEAFSGQGVHFAMGKDHKFGVRFLGRGPQSHGMTQT